MGNLTLVHCAGSKREKRRTRVPVPVPQNSGSVQQLTTEQRRRVRATARRLADQFSEHVANFLVDYAKHRWKVSPDARSVSNNALNETLATITLDRVYRCIEAERGDAMMASFIELMEDTARARTDPKFPAPTLADFASRLDRPDR
jgi:hypothetical protein